MSGEYGLPVPRSPAPVPEPSEEPTVTINLDFTLATDFGRCSLHTDNAALLPLQVSQEPGTQSHIVTVALTAAQTCNSLDRTRRENKETPQI